MAAPDDQHNLTNPPYSAPSNGVIPISVSPRGRWYNKENRAPERWHKRDQKMSKDYAWSDVLTRSLSDQGIAKELVGEGNTISVAVYRGDWVSEKNFIRAYIVAGDYDHGPDVQTVAGLPLANDFAFLIYATANSTPENPKTRPLFILDEPITDVEEYRLLTKRLLHALSQHAPTGSIDTVCKDAARRFHGSAGGEHILRPGLRLPLVVLRTLPPHPDELVQREAEMLARPVIASKPGAKRSYAVKALDGMIADLARLSNVKDDYQNNTCNKLTWFAAHYAARGDLSRTEIFDGMEYAMRANGYIQAFGLHAFEKTFESGFSDGFTDTTYTPKCYLEQPKPRPRIAHNDRDQQSDRSSASAPLDCAQPAPEPVQPLTLWQTATFLYTSDTYPEIAHYVLRSGRADFSKTEYAKMAGVVYKTAEKRIEAALLWGSVSRLEILQDRGEGGNTTCKKYKRDLHGAAVGERYVLTPDRAVPMIRTELWKAVLEKLERGIPDTIFKAEAREAFPAHDDEYAARLQAVTSATARSMEAEEVMADDERLAVRIANDILRRADYDETPFTMDIDPANVTDVRRRAIEHLVATDPTANWLQGSEMSWVAGSKRSAMPALIRTSRLTPSANPTLTPVMLPGKNLYAEALVAAKKNKGALASWIDGEGKVIRGFTSSEPENAAGVLINQGKTYSRHEWIEPMPAEPKADQQPETAPLTPEQEAEQSATRTQKRARSAMTLRERGCMRARGYRYIPGPYGFWERREKGKPPQFAENTCEGMADALVADYERVLAQQDETLLDGADALGAEVRALA